MNRPIRILHFVDSLHIGGAERQVVRLMRGLSDEGFALHLACFRAEGPLLDEVPRLAAPVEEYRLGSLRSPRALTGLLRLAGSMRRNRIDVVHTTSLYPNVVGMAAAALARVPVRLASVRDMGTTWSPGLLRLQRGACRLADAVVVNAAAIGERLRREGYDPARIAVVPNGVVPPPPSKADGAALRAELGLAPDALLIAVVCRLHRVKRLEEFVDAAATLAPAHPRARFLIVGPKDDGADRAVYARELEERARRRGIGDRLLLTGARGDVPAVLGELAVSVLCSDSEGLSNTLLESMAAGVPVVATRVGGNPEIVEDGVTGLLVARRDPSALAAAIDRLLAQPDLAAELADAGRRRVAARFGVERLVAETAALYRQLLVRSRAGRRVALTPPGRVAP
jgi:glycosyltransferase involved in cell wall biosynthesis